MSRRERITAKTAEQQAAATGAGKVAQERQGTKNPRTKAATKARTTAAPKRPRIAEVSSPHTA
jgi:hypothetical protein